MWNIWKKEEKECGGEVKGRWKNAGGMFVTTFGSTCRAHCTSWIYLSSCQQMFSICVMSRFVLYVCLRGLQVFLLFMLLLVWWTALFSCVLGALFCFLFYFFSLLWGEAHSKYYTHSLQQWQRFCVTWQSDTKWHPINDKLKGSKPLFETVFVRYCPHVWQWTATKVFILFYSPR